MKTAIVYDWIDKWGGVERLLLTLHEIFPDADFFTSHYDSRNASWAKNLKIKTSFMQNLPSFIKKNRILSLPFYPFAFESFNFTEYDLVISVTSSFAKGIITKPGTKHICILLTSTRFLWSHVNEYIETSSKRFLAQPTVDWLQSWDLIAAQRPDKIIAISKHIAKRCKKYYKREAEVIYPPFDDEYWKSVSENLPAGEAGLKVKSEKLQLKTNSYYLVVSRLERYKKVDLAIKTFNKLGKPLVIVGKGTQEEKLKELAGNNVQFTKDLTDEELAYLYKHAKALIMPQDEDFGYTALEAQFFGCPVISYRHSGAAETITENETGILFDKPNEKYLTDAIERFETLSYNRKHESDYFRRWCWNQTLATFKEKISKAI